MPEVAILEDERVMRDALCDYLTRSGYSVQVATGDSELFLRWIRARPPAVVLLDLLLGELPTEDDPTGLRVLATMRDCAPETRTIVLSGSNNPAHVQRAVDYGVSAFL